MLPFDFDNVLCVETFAHLVKAREEAELVEMFPAMDQLCAQGPEGRFVHELIVPFVRQAEETSALKEVAEQRSHVATGAPLKRTFPPGSEWLYFKLYTGTATADHLLRDVLASVLREIAASNSVDRWFFIRYGDPDWHLRVRIHGDPNGLYSDALPKLQSVANSLLADESLWRVQLDTYEREVERYGGAEGMELAERFFHVDSEAVLEILELLDQGDEGLNERWRLALRGIDVLLSDLGFDLETKLNVMKEARDRFAKEFRVDTKFTHELGDKLRKERKHLEVLLDAEYDQDHLLAPGFEILRLRSNRLIPIFSELAAVERSGKLSVPRIELAPSYVHMFANRLLRSAQRKQELVLYDFLTQLYESKIARQKASR